MLRLKVTLALGLFCAGGLVMVNLWEGELLPGGWLPPSEFWSEDWRFVLSPPLTSKFVFAVATRELPMILMAPDQKPTEIWIPNRMCRVLSISI